MTESSTDEPRYTRVIAAQLADVSLELLERCETERLVQVRILRGGPPGYSARDVRHLARIGRLHQVLELDFPALEVALHMRRQILDLREQMESLEQMMVRREERLARELTDLRRRLAADSEWR